jgi:hypothetical protein
MTDNLRRAKQTSVPEIFPEGTAPTARQRIRATWRPEI